MTKIYSISNHTDSVPKLYHYFPETSETKAVLVMERIGKTLFELWTDLRPIPFISVTKIGLQMVSMRFSSASNPSFTTEKLIFFQLDVLEWMHSNGFTHNDLHSFNVGVGYKNTSKIYLIGKLKFVNSSCQLQKDILWIFFFMFFFLDFNSAKKEKNRTTWDLESLADILNEMTWPSAYNCDWVDLSFILYL